MWDGISLSLDLHITESLVVSCTANLFKPEYFVCVFGLRRTNNEINIICSAKKRINGGEHNGKHKS